MDVSGTAIVQARFSRRGSSTADQLPEEQRSQVMFIFRSCPADMPVKPSPKIENAHQTVKCHSYGNFSSGFLGLNITAMQHQRHFD